MPVSIHVCSKDFCIVWPAQMSRKRALHLSPCIRTQNQDLQLFQWWTFAKPQTFHLLFLCWWNYPFCCETMKNSFLLLKFILFLKDSRHLSNGKSSPTKNLLSDENRKVALIKNLRKFCSIWLFMQIQSLSDPSSFSYQPIPFYF